MSLLALEATNLLGVLALVLCFAMLAGGWRLMPAQSGCVAAAALLQTWLQSDPQLIAAAAAAIALGILARRNPPTLPKAPTLSAFALALALVAMAIITAPAPVVAIPLAIVLFGLMLTTRTAVPGVICLLNGVLLAITAVPPMQLRGLASLALAAMALTVAPPFARQRP